MQKDTSKKSHLLSYLCEKISSHECHEVIEKSPDFHEPNGFSSESFWKPLETNCWPCDRVAEICFVCGNLLVDADCRKARKLTDVYSACLFLKCYYASGSGLDFTSLAVRVLIEYTKQSPSADLMSLLEDFFISISQGELMPENLELFYLNLGFSYFVEKRQLKINSDDLYKIEDTDSMNCPTKWREILVLPLEKNDAG